MDAVYIGTTNYGKHYLSAPAAASWFRMVRDGCPPGGITDALRTPAEQEAVFRKHYTTNYAASAKIDRRQWNGQFWYRAYRPGTKTPWPSAATPGSPQARHVAGLSLDLNGATKAWVRANGYRYGWIKDLVSGEDWHMEYQAWKDIVLVNNPGTSVGGNLPNPGVTPVTPIIPKDWFDMADIEDLRSVVTSALTPLAVEIGNLQNEVRILKAKATQKQPSFVTFTLAGGAKGVAFPFNGTYMLAPSDEDFDRFSNVLLGLMGVAGTWEVRTWPELASLPAGTPVSDPTIFGRQEPWAKFAG